MKKVLLLIAVVAVLSGCGTNDKLTCTYDNTVGDVLALDKGQLYKDGKVQAGEVYVDGSRMEK